MVLNGVVFGVVLSVVLGAYLIHLKSTKAQTEKKQTLEKAKFKRFQNKIKDAIAFGKSQAQKWRRFQ